MKFGILNLTDSLSQSVKTILTHIGLWSLVILVPFMFNTHITDAEMRQQLRQQLQDEILMTSSLNYIFYGILMLIFYINYSFLIPKVFNSKGIKWYIVALILDYALFTLLMLLIIKVYEIKFPPPIYVFIMPFTLINALSFAIRIISERMADEQNRQLRENETLKSELSFLRSQISPHFLFNIMNNIVAMSRVKPELVEPTLIQLSQLMRYMLYESDESKVSIDKEIAYLDSYIGLQKMRFGQSINIIMGKKVGDTEGSLFLIEPMLLIPFVENAFKHGIGMIREPIIKIDISIENNQLTFNVLNKFNTETEEEKDFDSGIGLKNVRRRLELVYGQEHTLKAEAEKDVFVVNLKINLKKS
jgi:two-component system, LytTR family, sensor kinase